MVLICNKNGTHVIIWNVSKEVLDRFFVYLYCSIKCVMPYFSIGGEVFWALPATYLRRG